MPCFGIGRVNLDDGFRVVPDEPLDAVMLRAKRRVISRAGIEDQRVFLREMRASQGPFDRFDVFG
jgi:hypothetical protein